MRRVLSITVCWAATAAAAAGPPSGWRPFADDSPWNTPVPADAPSDPRYGDFFVRLAEAEPASRLVINIRRWSVPVWWTDVASAPRYDVPTIKWYVFNELVDPERDRVAEGVPIPEGAATDPMNDQHMCVADWEAGVAYDFLRAEYHGPGDWRARSVDAWDLRGPGVHERGVHSARGSGFPLLAGLILPHELAEGEIRHALALAMPNCLPQYYVYPASTTDGGSAAELLLPEGARLQLDPALEVEELGLSPEAEVIARALQAYGAYVCDNAGALALYAQQNAPEWEGLLTYDTLSGVPVDRLRVLQLPAWYYQIRPPWVFR